MKIKKAGYDEYASGGNLKILLIGGPGVGKTRFSSFAPKPIYADCEGGLASVADRGSAFAEISNTADMVDFLKYVKSSGEYQTVVIDSIDAFQRKVRDEWVEEHETFEGFKAWGFLNARMQMLTTRLLNLNTNVIVIAHFKDKTFKDDSGDDRREYSLQLSGDVKDSIFNDFDLVGWMGTYWDVDDSGERVQRRGITFTATPEKPFLKDRLNVFPKWVPIALESKDWEDILGLFQAKLDGVPESQETSVEVPSDEIPADAPGPEIIPPEDNFVPSREDAPKNVGVNDTAGLGAMNKTELIELAAAWGVSIPGNALKHEIVDALEKANAERVLEAAGAVKVDPEADILAAAEKAHAAGNVEELKVLWGKATTDATRSRITELGKSLRK